MGMMEKRMTMVTNVMALMSLVDNTDLLSDWGNTYRTEVRKHGKTKEFIQKEAQRGKQRKHTHCWSSWQ